jgi:hypothetical protein
VRHPIFGSADNAYSMTPEAIVEKGKALARKENPDV